MANPRTRTQANEDPARSPLVAPCPHYKGLSYLEAIEKLCPDLTNKQIAAMLGLSKITVDNALRRYVRRTPNSVENKAAPVPEHKTPLNVDYWELLNHAADDEIFHEKYNYWQDSETVSINTSDPIIVVYSGDWHLGSLAVNHSHFMAWVKQVLETEGVYLISCGPDIESRGQFKSILPTLRQSLSPEDQQIVFGGIWQELVDKKKLICGCWDNHSIEQYEKLIGFSPVAQMMAREIPYFRGMGMLRLKVGEQAYSHMITHQSRFNSSFNATHGGKQASRLLRAPVDVTVSAHYHMPAMEEGYDSMMMREIGYDIGGQWVAIRTGTFKTDCDYSIRYFAQGVFAAPCVVFHPDRRLMVPMWDLGRALTYIEGWKALRPKADSKIDQ